MKKILFIVLFVLFGLSSCKKENQETPGATDVKQEKPLTDQERLEGKVVNAEDGEWYVIKDGMRWKALSEPATTDYLKSIENGENHVVKNVSLTILEKFPIAGEILPNAKFKEESEAEIFNNKLVQAENGEWFAVKDGQRWRAMSEPATTDYLKSIENGRNNIMKNVPLSTLEQFPVVGEVLPKTVYKLDSSTAKK